jgi:hypothetical protein
MKRTWDPDAMRNLADNAARRETLKGTLTPALGPSRPELGTLTGVFSTLAAIQ